MQNYINSKKAEILKTFDDFQVVLVEIMSANPEIAGKIVAISKNTGGYESLDAAIINYNLLEDDSLAIGITSKCISLMKAFEEQLTAQNVAKKCEQCNAFIPYNANVCPSCGKIIINETDSEFAKFIKSHFGCALTVFLSIILFIILCLIL